MKSGKVVLLMFILVLNSFVNAQSNKTSKVSVGFKGGLNLSNLYVDDIDDENVLIGFNGGLFLDLPLSKLLVFS